MLDIAPRNLEIRRRAAIWHERLLGRADLSRPELRNNRRKEQVIRLRVALRALPAAALLLAGCHRVTGTVSQIAENTRTATEQMAFDSEAQNARREARIDPYVGELRRPPPLRFAERYETREGPDGLFIYDSQRHSIARIGSQSQAGLSVDQAQSALDALNAAEVKHPGQ